MSDGLVRETLQDAILRVFGEVWRAERGGEPPPMTAETVLLETGLDSMGFAILVAELDAQLGYDPFALATEMYYPQTFADFLAFYEKHRPA